MGTHSDQWNDSHERGDNHTFFPREEVVKFLNRFVRKKLSPYKFIDHLQARKEFSYLRGLDYGCGIGRMTVLMEEFGIDSIGVDISETAIALAKQFYPDSKAKFLLSNGTCIPFGDNYFDVVLCEGVLDSMSRNCANTVIHELERVTSSYLFASFIKGSGLDYPKESDGDVTVESQHEYGTIQSYYTMDGIEHLIQKTRFIIKWIELHTSVDLLNNMSSRYHVVFEKL